MGHQMRHFMHELKTGEYMSNDHAARVAKAEFEAEQQRKKRGLLADQFNLDCNLPPLPPIDFTAARYPAAADSGERTRVSDPVNKPAHYTAHKSGVECIQITEHMGFNIGNAVKYLWRCDLKNDAIEDLEKSIWYIRREIDKRKKAAA